MSPKTQFAIVCTLAVLFPSSVLAADVTPHNLSDGATPLFFDTGDPEVYTFAIFPPDGQQELTTERGANNGHTWDELIGFYDYGTYHALLQNNLYDPCLQLTYTQCLADPSYLGVDILIHFNSPAIETYVETGGGTISYRPDVNILSPKGATVFSSEGTIVYQAADKNDAGRGVGENPFGLPQNPVSLFYSDKILEWEHTIVENTDKTLIVDKLPPVGSYDWHILGLSPGSLYRIVADAIDKVGELGEDVSDFFTLDLTPPTFFVSADPPVTKLGKVHIHIDASENLRNPPEVTVTQRGGKAVPVDMEGKILDAPLLISSTTTTASPSASSTERADQTERSSRRFEGIYEVLAGYDGTAKITVSAVDHAGNVGTTTLSGGNFNVGVEPPPPPSITSPTNKESITGGEIIMKGTAREDTDVLLTVNGVPTATVKPRHDGAFVIEKIKLDKTLPHGENVLSVVARDQAGNIGDATVLRLLSNSSPTVLLRKPAVDSILSGTTTVLLAQMADENNDPLSLRYELLSRAPSENTNKQEEWTPLGETLSGKLLFDTTAFPDGQYLLRAIVSDNATTTTSEIRQMTIKNELPLFKFEDGRRTIIRRGGARVDGTVVAPTLPDRPKIMRIEYSKDGKWFAVRALDGAYGSFEERFTAFFPRLAEGTHEILWRTTDSRGLTVYAKHPIIVDSTPPLVPSLLSIENNSLIDNSGDEDPQKQGLQMTLSGKAEPRSMTTLQLDGRFYNIETAFDGAWRQAVTIENRGAYNIKANATDVAGNTSPTTTLHFIYDNAPEVVFTKPRGGRGVHGVSTITWFVKDPDGDNIVDTVLSYRRGDSAFVVLVKDPKENSFAWDTTKFPAGDDYALRLEASDGFATTSKVISLAIDNEPPILSSLIVPQKTFMRNGIFAANGLAADDFSGVEFVEYAITKEGEKSQEKIWLKAKITNGFLAANASWSLREPLQHLSDGAYHFFVRAVDASGNTSSAKEERFNIDSTPPHFGSLTLSYHNAPLFPSGGHFTVLADVSLSLALALENDTNKASVEVDGLSFPLKKEQASGLWVTDLSLSKVGTTTVSFVATDLSGNTGGQNDLATIVVVLPGTVSARSGGTVLALAQKTIEVLVADPNSNVFSVWNGESSLYGAPTDLPNGKYVLALPRGTYRLVVSSDGFSRLTTQTFRLDEAQFLTDNFTLVKERSIWGMMTEWLRNVLHR